MSTMVVIKQAELYWHEKSYYMHQVCLGNVQVGNCIKVYAHRIYWEKSFRPLKESSLLCEAAAADYFF